MRIFVTGGLAPFRSRIFAAFWSAYFVSALGTQVQLVGAAWLMMSLTSSASRVSLITAASSLPVLCLAMISGAICDLFDKRLVLLVAQSIMLCSASVLALCTAAHVASPWLLIGCTFSIGCGFALNAPAWQSIVRELVQPADVPAAIAANSLAFNSGRMIGPAIGGIIVAGAGSAAAFFTNAASYLGLLVIIFRWRSTPVPHTARERETLIAAILTGARYAMRSPAVRSILWRDALYGVASAGILALLPLIARERLTGGALGYGILLASLGVGSIIGGIAITPLRMQVGPSRAVKGAFLLAAVSSGAIIIAHSYALYLCVLFMGMSTVMALSTLNAAIQLSVPRRLAGRVISLHQTALFGGLAGGSVFWGGVASRFGLTTAIGGSALVMVALRLLSGSFRVRFDSDED
jgi:predicted MFS family arabinose efflux permease